MLNFLKRNKQSRTQLISVIEYPDKLVIETYFRLESWVWRRTDIVSVLSKDNNEKEIHDGVLKHLAFSKIVKERNYDFEKMENNYNKLIGLKSIKSQMADSKMVQIFRDNNDVTFTPMKNGGAKGIDKGYSEIIEKIIKMNESELRIKTLNDSLKISFANCE